MKPIKIHTEMITLGQFLKYVNIASSGGEVKVLLETLDITVDGIHENRRGKKLIKGSVITIPGHGTYRIDT